MSDATELAAMRADPHLRIGTYHNSSYGEYERMLSQVLALGVQSNDRTGTGTRSLFGMQMRFDLSKGFPLITTKRVFWRGVVEELLWMLRGETNIQPLKEKGIHIWDEWADACDDLGPVYGSQWRKWNAGWPGPKFDQIKWLINEIQTNPNSRRLIVTAWNPQDVPLQALPPCHVLFQFYVRHGTLSCHLYQRSGDMFLGVPFNIASYALLTHLVAHQTGLRVGEFIHTIGDCHIYNNHLPQVAEQLTRKPRPYPQLGILGSLKLEGPMQAVGKCGRIEDYEFKDFNLVGYDPHPAIKAEVAV